MFPDNFTKHHEVSDSKRAFMMGNALVVGVVEKLGKSLYRQLWVYKNENYKQTCSTCEVVFNSYHFYDDGTPKYDHKNQDSVLKYAKKLEGKTLKEVSGEYIRNAGVKGNAKGKFGSNLEKFYFGYEGNHDSCIAIRTAIISKNILHLQSGAGIVSDSVPENEYQETMNKAKGMLKALALAEQISH